MKIAVVRTGISAMVAASVLQREHNVIVFEARDRIGGHTNTVDVELEGRRFAVDTGFIVHNPRTYLNLISIFEELGVAQRLLARPEARRAPIVPSISGSRGMSVTP